MIQNITTLISAWIRDIWVSLYVSESEGCASLSSVVICVSYLLWNLSLHYAKITQTLLSNDLSTPSVCSDKPCILSSQSSPVIGSLLFSFTTSTPSWAKDQVNRKLSKCDVTSHFDVFVAHHTLNRPTICSTCESSAVTAISCANVWYGRNSNLGFSDCGVCDVMWQIWS